MFTLMIQGTQIIIPQLFIHSMLAFLTLFTDTSLFTPSFVHMVQSILNGDTQLVDHDHSMHPFITNTIAGQLLLCPHDFVWQQIAQALSATNLFSALADFGISEQSKLYMIERLLKYDGNTLVQALKLLYKTNRIAFASVDGFIANYSKQCGKLLNFVAAIKTPLDVERPTTMEDIEMPNANEKITWLQHPANDDMKDVIMHLSVKPALSHEDRLILQRAISSLPIQDEFYIATAKQLLEAYNSDDLSTVGNYALDSNIAYEEQVSKALHLCAQVSSLLAATNDVSPMLLSRSVASLPNTMSLFQRLCQAGTCEAQQFVLQQIIETKQLNLGMMQEVPQQSLLPGLVKSVRTNGLYVDCLLLVDPACTNMQLRASLFDPLTDKPVIAPFLLSLLVCHEAVNWNLFLNSGRSPVQSLQYLSAILPRWTFYNSSRDKIITSFLQFSTEQANIILKWVLKMVESCGTVKVLLQQNAKLLKPLMQALIQDEAQLENAIHYLSSHPSVYAQDILLWLYSCFPAKVSVKLITRMPTLSSKVDLIMHRLVYLLATPDLYSFAYHVYRHIASEHPFVAIHYMSSLLTILETTQSVTATEILQRGLARVYLQVLGIIEMLKPTIFVVRIIHL